jgi:hypothetical protein
MANRIRPHNVRQNTTQKIKDWATQTPRRTRMNSGTPEMKAFPAQLVAPFVYSCKKKSDDESEKKTRLWLRQTWHIRGHLRHR